MSGNFVEQINNGHSRICQSNKFNLKGKNPLKCISIRIMSE